MVDETKYRKKVKEKKKYPKQKAAAKPMMGTGMKKNKKGY